MPQLRPIRFFVLLSLRSSFCLYCCTTATTVQISSSSSNNNNNNSNKEYHQDLLRSEQQQQDEENQKNDALILSHDVDEDDFYNNYNNNNNNNIQRRNQQQIKLLSTSKKNMNNLRVVNNNNNDANNNNFLMNLPNIKSTNAVTQILQNKTKETITTTSTDDARSNNNNNNNLIAIVHIGPHKTGTTTIQALTSILHNELNIDRYEMPWGLIANDIHHVNAEPYIDLNQFNLVSCLYGDDHPKPLWEAAKCNPKLINATIDIATIKKQNVIISAEELSRNIVQINKLYNLLYAFYNTIRIIVYYRRFYDWLYSYWQQIVRYHPINKRGTFINYVINNKDDILLLYNDSYVTSCVQRYKQYFNNNNNNKSHNHEVIIYNMHNIIKPYTDLSEVFFCSGLIDATNTCNKIQERIYTKNKTIHFNDGHAFIYDELAYYASELNYYNSTSGGYSSIDDVIQLVKNYQEIQMNLTRYDFPKEYIICPNATNDDDFDYILQMTLHDEQLLFPDQQTEKEIISSYQLYQKTMFCYIDAKAIIQNNNTWQQFFQSL